MDRTACCIYCAPDVAPFICSTRSDHFPGFFPSTISQTIQNGLAAYAVQVKLLSSGVLTAGFGGDQEGSFWTQAWNWTGVAVLRRVYKDKWFSLLEQKHQDSSGAACCYPNFRKTLLISRGGGCLQARLLLDPLSSCAVLG